MSRAPSRRRGVGDSPEDAALAAIDRPVSLFGSALAGRPLTLQLAPAADQAAAVTLTPALLAKPDPRLPWGAMRIEVLSHVVQLQAGGRWQFERAEAAARGLIGPHVAVMPGDPLQQCLASWSRPVLLRRLFRIIDGGRVDARIEQQFPGARADLQTLRSATLARIGDSTRPLHVLQRLALGVGDPLQELPLLAAALRDTATVYDSLQAAIGLCALLGHGRRRDDLVLPHWLVIEPPPPDPGLPGTDDDGGAPLDPAASYVPQAMRHARLRTGTDDPTPLRAAPGTGQPATDATAAVEGRRPDDAPARSASAAEVTRHDEWNYLEQRYRRAWTQVHEHPLRGEDLQFLARLRQRHAGLAASIRRRIGKVRPLGRERLRHTRDGDEIDVEAAMTERIERRAGQAGDLRVYSALQPARREVCTAFLLDISGSTGFLVPDREASADSAALDDDPYFYASPRRRLAPPPPRRRVIDVAKDAIALMCDALARLGDRHAVWGFSGDGRQQVDFYLAKAFDEAWSAHSAAALARLEPKGSTRTGAAIRHAARKLARQPERLRLLIVVTDGYPQDSDYGPDPEDIDYGLRDTAQALREAERAGLAVFCVSVDHAAHDYLRRVCPASRYLVIDDVGALPEQLSNVYRQLTRRGAR
jgi:nitric oxide reductase NorD protein